MTPARPMHRGRAQAHDTEKYAFDNQCDDQSDRDAADDRCGRQWDGVGKYLRGFVEYFSIRVKYDVDDPPDERRAHRRHFGGQTVKPRLQRFNRLRFLNEHSITAFRIRSGGSKP